MASEQQSFLFDDPETPLLDLPLSRPLVFFDLETTGLDIPQDRIVQFAFIKVDPDKNLTEWKELVHPGIPIPPEASRVHGITDDMVADKPVFSYFAPRIGGLLHDSDLAGFNAARFDIPFLQAEMERAGFPLDLAGRRIVDAQVIFHRREPRDLSAAYRFYCRKELEGAHDALADVRATLEVLEGQFARYPDLPRDVAKLGAYCTQSDESRWVAADRKFYWKNNEAVISFGKHRGNSLRWIVENYPDYLQWMLDKLELAEETRAMLTAAREGEFLRKDK